MTNTVHKASSHLICTQSAFTMSAIMSDAIRHVSYGSFFRLTADTISEIFYYSVSQMLKLSNSLLMTILFSAGQHSGTSCMQHSQTAGARTLNFTSINNDLQLNSPAVKLLIMRFRDSHISKSISCKPTRLKKSSSDWLKWKDVIFVFFYFTRQCRDIIYLR